jgi:condensin complex subunit 1
MTTFELQDELQDFQDVESYNIKYDHDFSSEDPESLLEGVVQPIACRSEPLISHRISIAAVEAVATSSEAIHDPEVFDVYRSVLKHSDMVPGQTMTKLLDSLLSGLQSELDATLRDIDTGDQETYAAHKTPLEMFAFLLHWFVTAAEKVKVSQDDAVPPPPTKPKKGRGGKAAGGSGRTTSRSTAKKTNETWTWEDQIPNTLALTAKILRQLQTQRLWITTAERDTFVK